MAQTKVQVARKRNWLKARIMGSYWYADNETVTQKEKLILREIESLRKLLIENWDNSSRELGMFVGGSPNRKLIIKNKS